MIADAIEKIKEMSAPVQQVVEDRVYMNKPLVPVKEPVAETIEIHTLTGMVDYIRENPDRLDLDRLTVHVLSPGDVRLLSPLAPMFLGRSVYVRATLIDDPYPYGQWQTIEDFIILIQGMFVQDETTASILKLVGNLRDEAVKTMTDDGVTQIATAKTGVATVDEVEVPNPVTLRPYRTFRELEQPPGEFVFRIRSGEPTAAALFGADGGSWRVVAIEGIRDFFLNSIIGSDIKIIA